MNSPVYEVEDCCVDLREAATRLYISLQYRQQVRFAAERRQLTSGPAQLTRDTTTPQNLCKRTRTPRTTRTVQPSKAAEHGLCQNNE